MLLGVLAVALVATGFAHRVSAADERMAALLLATGAVAADFCGDAVPGAGHRGSDCQACQITGGADLPPPGGVAVPMAFRLISSIPAPRENARVRRSVDLAHAPQGPPVG